MMTTKQYHKNTDKRLKQFQFHCFRAIRKPAN